MLLNFGLCLIDLNQFRYYVLLSRLLLFIDNINDHILDKVDSHR